MIRLKTYKTMLQVVFTCLLIVPVISACKSKQATSVTESVVVVPEAPAWVNSRPQNSAYYIGIGRSSKIADPLEYQNNAKKNALNDLASEISVRVRGETFLNSLEVNKSYSEDFMSVISTFTDERVEDFEVAGVWENDREYWIYYRLNKAEYQRQKAEKKNKALSSAYDYYLKGKTAESEANIPLGFDMYMRGLFAMKDYWKEVNEYTTTDGNIHLDNEIFSSIQRLATGLKITSNSPKISLSSENNYQVNFPIRTEYNGSPAKGISVSYSYSREEYFKPRTLITDNDGYVYINISNVNTLEKSNQLSLAISLEPLISKDLDQTIQSGLVKNLTADQRQIPIDLVTPAFYLSGTELNFGQPGQNSILVSALTNELVRKGMRISPTAKDSHYQVKINSDTRDSGTTQGFHSAQLDMRISVINSLTKEIIYEESFSGIKGLQLNTAAAGNEAYKKGKEKIESDVVKSILQFVF